MADPRPNDAPLATWRSLAALGVAGGLALLVGGSLARAPRLGSDAVPVRHYERALAPVRAALRPGDRVALLVADDDLGPWFATQYALAPAVVVRVRARDCLAVPPARCAAGATHLLAAGLPPAEAAALGARLGFVPVATSVRGVLLARSAR